MQTINKEIPRNILLNPGPATTSARVKSAMIVSDICPREAEFGKLLDDVRAKILKVVNGSNKYETVLFGSSGTGAMEASLSSCVNEGEAILIVENGAYGQRMNEICMALGMKSYVVKFAWGEKVDLNVIEDFIKENSQEIKVLAFIHHETTTGMLNPLEDLNDLAKKYKLSTLVDCMSSFAGIEIDLEKVGIDYLLSSSNKCIQAMAGLGIVIVSNTELERIKNFKTHSYYFNLYKNFKSQKNSGQFLFTPPAQLLYCLNEALDEFFEEGGIKVRAQRYFQLFTMMHNGMIELGFKPYLEDLQDCSHILTSYFEPESKNYTFESMHDYLYEKGITIYPGKVNNKNTFRISNIGELTSDDMKYFLSEISSYSKKFNIF